MPLRVCVIGMGPIGNRHARIYNADPLAELVGVCDVLKERADAAAASARSVSTSHTPTSSASGSAL